MHLQYRVLVQHLAKRRSTIRARARKDASVINWRHGNKTPTRMTKSARGSGADVCGVQDICSKELTRCCLLRLHTESQQQQQQRSARR